MTCDTTKEGLDWCQLLMCILLQPSTCNTGYSVTNVSSIK